MTGLVAPAPTNDPVNAVVEADGWYPAVPLDAVREAVRLGDGAVTTMRLTAAIEGAMFAAMRELAAWRERRVAAGAAELADVTDQELNGSNAAEKLWTRAVVYLAAAELADGHRDLSATSEGMDRAETKDLTADHFRRLATHALADLLSLGEDEAAPRNRVSLV